MIIVLTCSYRVRSNSLGSNCSRNLSQYNFFHTRSNTFITLKLLHSWRSFFKKNKFASFFVYYDVDLLRRSVEKLEEFGKTKNSVFGYCQKSGAAVCTYHFLEKIENCVSFMHVQVLKFVMYVILCFSRRINCLCKKKFFSRAMN